MGFFRLLSFTEVIWSPDSARNRAKSRDTIAGQERYLQNSGGQPKMHNVAGFAKILNGAGFAKILNGAGFAKILNGAGFVTRARL
jgi:hypothetical protein